MMQKLKNSIGFKLGLLITVLFVSVSGMIILMFNNTYKNYLLTHTEEELIKSTETNIQKIVENLNTYESELKDIVDKGQVESMSVEQQLIFLKYLKVNDFKKIEIINNNGFLVGPNNEKIKKDFSKYYNRITNENNEWNVYYTEEGLIEFYYPLYNTKHEIVSIVIGKKDPERIFNILKIGATKQEEYLFVVNKEGTIIAHNNNKKYVEEKFNPLKLSANDSSLSEISNVFKSMTLGETGYNEYTLEGISKFTAYSPIEGTGWSFASSLDKNYILKDLANFKDKALAMYFFCFIIGIILGVILSNIIKRPLLKLQRYCEELAKGNLNVEIITKRSDEYGKTEQALSNAIKSIKDIILKIDVNSEDIEQISTDISVSSKNIGNVSSEITTTIQEIAQGMTEQIIQTEKCFELSNELSNRIETISTGFNEVREMSNKMKEKNKEGFEKINELTNDINESNDSFLEIKNSTLSVLEKSKVIREKIDIINNITQQTKLLSLNATIEAARAGEFGRGFTVVAEEIRKLSENCHMASDEINKAMKDITEAINNTYNMVEKTAKTNSKVESSLVSTNEVFHSINNSVDTTLENIESLTKKMNEMNKTKDDTLQSVENIYEVTQLSAAGAEEISASTEDQLKSIEEIITNILTLNQLVHNLNETKTYFDV